MNYKDITERLNPIFRETFDDDTININAEMVASDIEQWDSLNNIRLMVRIEELFGIFFETSELAGLANVGELINVIKEKLD
jgi:acyl carrier protein